MPRTQIKKSVLIATRITPYTNDRVKEAVEKYKKGELKETEAPNVGSHHGMGGR